jgi:hypothetical protein
MEQHRERPLDRAAALDYAIHDRVVLGGDLVLAGDRGQPDHGSPFRRFDQDTPFISSNCMGLTWVKV